MLENLEFMSHCTHDDLKHRAKFMCHSCNFTKGNIRKASACIHKNKSHHSRGLCKGCYHKVYYKIRKDPKVDR